MTDDSEESPLIKALPPATDYMTYLTIVDTCLTKEELPLLHDLLQDERLTTNIGWDLVQILLPMLPESEECLHDVACMGNPREVVLKVTELLEELGVQLVNFENNMDEDEDENGEENNDDGPKDAKEEGESPQNAAAYQDLCAKFQCLIHMLCVLHPRIKTKYPSRFLKTSAETIISVHHGFARFPAATRSVLMFLRALSGSKRPTLPPRGTEEAIPTVKTVGTKADPEADSAPDESEANTSKQLLRSLATQIARQCVESFSPVAGTSGLAWVDRYAEKREPNRIVPGRQTYKDIFTTNEDLLARDSLVSQLLNICTGDLKIPVPLLFPLNTSEQKEAIFSESLPHSPTGSLYLLSARTFLSLQSSSPLPTTVSLPTSHFKLISTFIGAPDPDSLTLPSASVASPALVDALLLLGWASLSAEGLTSDSSVSEDTEFNTYLQAITLIAATHPAPQLRAQANDFAAAVLAAHKSTRAQISFVRDTLEYCPYESLKAAALGWTKGSLVRGNGVWGEKDGLASLAGVIWTPVEEGMGVEEWVASVPLFVAGCNLLYLLCENEALRDRLKVAEVNKEAKINETFVTSLEKSVERVKTAGDAEDLAGDLLLVEDAIARAKEGLARLEKS